MDWLRNFWRHFSFKKAPPVPNADMDAFYFAFEEHFRGSEAEISRRLADYLPYLTAVSAETPLLDLGCGRGELLQLAKKHSLAAQGIDTSAAMVNRARSQGLEVTKAPALPYLRKQPDERFGAISAIHLAEHLSFAELFALCREAYRTLTPGGVCIIETPNPENVTVGAHTFYNDPSHRHPLPPQLLEFLLQYLGFSHTEIRRFRPIEAIPHGKNQRQNEANKLLFGPTDYAVVARK